MSLLSMLDQVKQAVVSPFESKSQPKAQGVQAHSASGSAGTTGTGTATSPTNQATITANDFLTLLVTEIKNQDPTQQTDPMQYITQLVGVNSLEQLVQINQTLSTSAGAITPTGSAAGSPSAATPAAATAKHASQQAATVAAAQTAAHLLPLGSNVQLPASSETAVAQALTHASTLPTQAIAPTQIPLDPAVMRALQHSIPGATMTGSPSLPAASAPLAGAAAR